MGFKMKGFNAGKGTGSSFTYGTHVTQPDGSVIWTPPKEEYIEPPKEKDKWDKKVDKHIAIYENAKKNFETVPTRTLKILNQYDPDWLSKQNYHTLSNIDNVYGLDFDDNVKRYDRKGNAVITNKNKRYNKFREMGMSHEEAMLKANIKFDPKTDDSTTHRSEHRQTENQWEEDPNIVINSNYDDPNNPNPSPIAPEISQSEQEEIDRIESEIDDMGGYDDKDYVLDEDKHVFEDESSSGDDSVNVNEYVDDNVPIGSGEDDDASIDVEEKTFDPADTNQDGVVDKWEAKAAKRAAMFAKKSNPHKFDSPEWWDWKNASNKAKSNTKKSAFTVLSKYGKKWI